MHAGLAIVLSLWASVASAGFVVSARSEIQILSYRQLQPFGGLESLPRQRITQWLTLAAWRARRPRAPQVSFRQAMRFDHDFGAFTAGLSRYDGGVVSALDVVPELATAAFGLELLYATLTVDGIWDGRLDAEAGRLLRLDEFEPWGLDGGGVTWRAHEHVDVRASGGLMVRSASLWGTSLLELDGTGLAECREYREAETIGDGRWQIIDRAIAINRVRTQSDLFICPQRQARMWATEAEVSLRHGRVEHRLRYRTAWSGTPGLIDDPNRFDVLDLGLYPSEFTPAPTSGTNLAQLSWASNARWHGGGAVWQPHLFLRYSLLERAWNRAEIGLTATAHKATLGAEVRYLRPTFDADSLFTIFAFGGTAQTRVWLQRGAWAAAGWLMRTTDDPAWAGGGDAGTAWSSRRWRLAAGVAADAGLDGSRLGARMTARRPIGKLLALSADLASWRLARGSAAYWLATARTRGEWSFADNARLTVQADATINATTEQMERATLRALLVFELTLEPEF